MNRKKKDCEGNRKRRIEIIDKKRDWEGRRTNMAEVNEKIRDRKKGK